MFRYHQIIGKGATKCSTRWSKSFRVFFVCFRLNPSISVWACLKPKWPPPPKKNVFCMQMTNQTSALATNVLIARNMHWYTIIWKVLNQTNDLIHTARCCSQSISSLKWLHSNVVSAQTHKRPEICAKPFMMQLQDYETLPAAVYVCYTTSLHPKTSGFCVLFCNALGV